MPGSIATMMQPRHLRAPSKSPVAASIVRRAMEVQPDTIPALQPRNGAGHYVLPLQRIHFTYCSHCGDSHGIR